MELTVGVLREIIKDLPDDIILADLDFGNEGFNPHVAVKRLLLLERDGQKFLTINRMGSHFTGKEWQKGLEYTGKYWDKSILEKGKTNE